MQSSRPGLQGRWPFAAPEEESGPARSKSRARPKGRRRARSRLPRPPAMASASPAADGGRRVAVWLKAEDLQCSICLSLLTSPATLLCGHSFCLECIRRWAQVRGEGRGRGCPNCQRGFFFKRLPERNVFLEALLEKYRRAAFADAVPKEGTPRLQFSVPGAGRRSQQPAYPKRQDVVKISEVSKETELAIEAIASWAKESDRVKDYVSQRKNTVIENFSFLKKYINDKEETVLKVIDEEYNAAQQKIEAINEQLRERINRLVDLQNNSKEQLQAASSEQEVYISSPVAMNEVTLDVQKISSISYAVEELKRVLETSVLETCLGQLLQEPSPGTSKIGDIEMDVALEESISSSNSSWSQDSLQETGSDSSAVASASNTAVPIVSRQFSQWASNVTFDHKRIHHLLELSKDKKKVTVSRFRSSYESSNMRFRTSQVMGSPGFSEGCHYWEAVTKDSSGWAVGVADEKIGRDDQLGRTELSWCIEWSNKRLSAWHNHREIQIKQEKPLQVGVFLDIPRNTLSFYSLTDIETCLHQFKINVVNPVYPAFWIYGSCEGEFLTIYDI
ncbi:hypothetical protein lerEdw1_003743 [Lerista edwardsae]|nr:hypothetical protein lerEdw1_003743 [Lerista edwardsae]